MLLVRLNCSPNHITRWPQGLQYYTCTRKNWPYWITNLICSGVPPEMALHTTQTASFLVLNSAVLIMSSTTGNTPLSISVCEGRREYQWDGIPRNKRNANDHLFRTSLFHLKCTNTVYRHMRCDKINNETNLYTIDHLRYYITWLTCIWTLLPAAMLDIVQQASFLTPSWLLLHKYSNDANTEQFNTTCREI